MDKHTSTAWQLIYICACPPSAFHDLDSCEPICSLIKKSDAAFIVRAVNAHEELLQGLKDTCNLLERECPTVVKHWREVIVKAEGK